MSNNTLPITRIDEESNTTYAIETAFFSSISRGNIDEVNVMIKKLLKSGIVVNKLSKDDTRPLKYWAINTIAIATRYAIAGGADETACYAFTDEAIMQIDSLTDESEILQFLFKKSLQLVATVNKVQQNTHPKAVRDVLKIINTRLFDDLKLDILAKECGISKDHLSLLFKKSFGVTIPQYIKTQRLDASKDMLKRGMSLSEVAAATGFSTESYFIKCFKDEFGMTPGEFMR
ncbi:MAG: helix-turn-helix domain-containing protein [Ruminococcaceae bacterium]|nr:helix-turn-helix domain-containing protein [Oscillospiraceae bacterium]